MITATFSVDEKSHSISMKMKGHAQAGDPGYDLICAGASTLAYTLAQCLRFMHEQGKLRKEPHLLLRPGRAEITAKPRTPEAYAEALHTFFVIQAGLSLLQENYPEHVQVTMFDLAETPLSKESST